MSYLNIIAALHTCLAKCTSKMHWLATLQWRHQHVVFKQRTNGCAPVLFSLCLTSTFMMDMTTSMPVCDMTVVYNIGPCLVMRCLKIIAILVGKGLEAIRWFFHLNPSFMALIAKAIVSVIAMATSTHCSFHIRQKCLYTNATFSWHKVTPKWQLRQINCTFPGGLHVSDLACIAVYFGIHKMTSWAIEICISTIESTLFEIGLSRTCALP